jgi:hypothetical protein
MVAAVVVVLGCVVYLVLTKRRKREELNGNEQIG